MKKAGRMTENIGVLERFVLSFLGKNRKRTSSRNLEEIIVEITLWILLEESLDKLEKPKGK